MIHEKGEAKYGGKLFQQNDRQSQELREKMRPGTAASCLTKTTDSDPSMLMLLKIADVEKYKY